MNTANKQSVFDSETYSRNLTPILVAEMSALPDKFFTFTHEGISMIWLKESTSEPIRGIRSEQK